MQRRKPNRARNRRTGERLAARVAKPQKQNRVARARSRAPVVPINQRLRGGHGEEKLPFSPPEDWHEPLENDSDYRVIVQPPGQGYRHVVTQAEVRQRLAELPSHFLRSLEVVQLSQVTRKKQRFPCYGMQWGAALYLYPIEESLVERYSSPPSPERRIEARMYGGRWEPTSGGGWDLVWTEQAIKDFYLNNILIHELGHLLDERNTSYVDRERYAEWFAIEYGYRRSQRLATQKPTRSQRRHHRKAAIGY